MLNKTNLNLYHKRIAQTATGELEEASQYPLRYQHTLIFLDPQDGVEIIEDLSDDEIPLVVKYFVNDESAEIDSGALYEWAVKKYQELN